MYYIWNLNLIGFESRVQSTGILLWIKCRIYRLGVYIQNYSAGIDFGIRLGRRIWVLSFLLALVYVNWDRRIIASILCHIYRTYTLIKS